MIPEKKTPRCNACGQVFKDWQGLALHITQKKDRAHQRSRKFAAKVLAGSTLHPDAPKRQPKIYDPDKKLDPELRRIFEEREEKYRLSGRVEFAPCYCPMCKQPYRGEVPVEYKSHPDFGRENGAFVISHESCRGIKR